MIEFLCSNPELNENSLCLQEVQERPPFNVFYYASRDCLNLNAVGNLAGYFFLQIMENSRSLQANIFLDYNAASTIRIETENISTSSPPLSLCFHA